MGSPESPIVVNLYMEKSANAIISYTWLTTRVWKWYVDDIFAVIKKREKKKFFNYINSVDDNVELTEEERLDMKQPS